MMDEEDLNVIIHLDKKNCSWIDDLEKFEKKLENQEAKVLKHSEYHSDILHGLYKSGIERWSTDRVAEKIDTSTETNVFIPDCFKHLPMSKHANAIATAIEKYDVILIESPIGTGKSVLCPTILENYVRKTGQDGTLFPSLPKDQSWKIAHAVPNGEQCVKHVEYIGHPFLGRIHFGYYTSAVGDEDLKQKKMAYSHTNYMYCTYFYGNKVFNGYLHAIVIDDVHEWSQDLMEMFHKAKTAMNLSKSERNINKVILLSGSLSNRARNEIVDYFTTDTFTFTNLVYIDRMHSNKVIRISEMMTMQYESEERLYETEADRNGIPIIEELRHRSVAMQEKRIQKIEEQFVYNGHVLPEIPGTLAFFVGRSEASVARSEFMNGAVWKRRKGVEGTKEDRKFTALFFLVTTKNNTDQVILHEEKQSDIVRFINCTPIFSIGVTIPEISAIIDDCCVKLSGLYYHNGISYFETIFQDECMTLQKRGRCGRQGDGFYIPIVSDERYKEILDSDHTSLKLDRSYRTNDMVYVYDHTKEMMQLPSEFTMQQMGEDMFRTGFIINVQSWNSLPTKYARTLSRLFNSLPLVMSDLLLRCFAMGAELHGLLFVASCISEFGAIRKPNSNGPGRDDPKHPLQLWIDRNEALFESDPEVMTEMALNLMLCGPLKDYMKDCKNKGIIMRSAFVIDIKAFSCLEGSQDLYRIVNRLYGNLSYILHGQTSLMDFIVESLNHKYFLKTTPYSNGTYAVFRLNDDTATIFKSCILQSLGSRMGYIAPDCEQKNFGKRVMYRISGAVPKGNTRLIQGELPISSERYLVCYYEVMRRSKAEQFMTGVLHYVTASEFAIFGNVVGSANDEVDIKEFVLKITTNTSPIYFKFPDLKTLMAIVRMRSILRWTPQSMFACDESRWRKDMKEHQESMNEIKKMILYIYNHASLWITDRRMEFKNGCEHNIKGEFYRVSGNAKHLINRDGIIVKWNRNEYSSVSTSKNSSSNDSILQDESLRNEHKNRSSIEINSSTPLNRNFPLKPSSGRLSNSSNYKDIQKRHISDEERALQWNRQYTPKKMSKHGSNKENGREDGFDVSSSKKPIIHSMNEQCDDDEKWKKLKKDVKSMSVTDQNEWWSNQYRMINRQLEKENNDRKKKNAAKLDGNLVKGPNDNNEQNDDEYDGSFDYMLKY